MWGNIILEVSFSPNFHLGFNNTRSDVLIHLTQWQYWWWFWFTFLWGLYFLLFMRIFRVKVLKFRPRIVTSFRPHGKWGDIIVCLIPVSWCANIISNSNLILRMIEWQSESSLFTLRIRGRQWYWVYKYDFKSVTDFLSVPKNTGNNKWRVSTPTELKISDDYLQILQLRSHNKWIRRHWAEFLDKTLKEDEFNVTAPQELSLKALQTNSQNFNFFFTTEEVKPRLTTNLLVNSNDVFFDLIDDSQFDLLPVKFKKNLWKQIDAFEDSSKIFEFKCLENLLPKENKVNLSNQFRLLKTEYSTYLKQAGSSTLNITKFLNHDLYNEVSRWTKRSQGSISPLRIIKYPITNELELSSSSELNLLRFRFNEDQSTLIHKPFSGNNFLILKQKRYKPLKSIAPWNKFVRDSITGKKTSKLKSSRNMTLKNNTFIKDDSTQILKYKILKKSKVKSEDMPLVFFKRMLRTRRTLVLPAHVNITVITNSYDIIHSWFIPGLGLKMDCIPGRATHHVLHIDNVGFYYGQCAEICGRYHHHMPIRICALPFEHFLLWWHTFGISKLMYIRNDRQRFTKTYALRKYIW